MTLREESDPRPGLAALALMLLAGAIHLVVGAAAIAGDQVFHHVTDGYCWALSQQTWGWVHVGLGAGFVVTGLLMGRGGLGAALAGVAVAFAAAICSFAWLPYQPAWSVLAIGLDVAVVLALSRAVDRVSP